MGIAKHSKNIMRAAIYSPYLDTLGGGERYTLTFASILLKNGWNVDVSWKNQAIKKKIERRFGLDLKDMRVVSDIKRGEGYDLCFWVSDGSIPILHSRNNILHFQFPFKGIGGRNLLNKMKFFRINHVVVNSAFTKRFIDSEYGIDSEILYPPIDTKKFTKVKKQNIILCTGRFSQLTQSKRQDILIKVFNKLLKNKFHGWKLIFAGGSEIGADIYLKSLKKMIKTDAIKLIENPSFNDLRSLYSKAKIFWSASGFDIDEEKNPMKVEHFGITTVEAMAAGCVCLVYSAGGAKEIVENERNGYLWHNTKELESLTQKLIYDKRLQENISKMAEIDSKKYDISRFEKKVLSIL